MPNREYRQEENIKRLFSIKKELVLLNSDIAHSIDESGLPSDEQSLKAIRLYKEVCCNRYYSHARKLGRGKDSEEYYRVPLEFKDKRHDLEKAITYAERCIIRIAESLKKRSASLAEEIISDGSQAARNRLYDLCDQYDNLLKETDPQPGADGLSAIVDGAFADYCEFHKKLETRNALLDTYSLYLADIKRGKPNQRVGLKEIVRETRLLDDEFRRLEKASSCAASRSHIPSAYSTSRHSDRCRMICGELRQKLRERGLWNRLKSWLSGAEGKKERDLREGCLPEENVEKEECPNTLWDALKGLESAEGGSCRLREIFLAKGDPALSDIGNRFLVGAEYIKTSLKQPTYEDKLFLKVIKYSILRDAEAGYVHRKLRLQDLLPKHVDDVIKAADEAMLRKTAKQEAKPANRPRGRT